MDLGLQIEKLYGYLALRLSISDMKKMLDVKKSYNNDFNLLGCFFKDFLILKNNFQEINDSKVYENLVLYIEKNMDNNDSSISEIARYSKYYLVLIFEEMLDEVEDKEEILGCISTINAFYTMEFYPLLLEKFDEFFNLKIDGKIFLRVLKFIVDTVIDGFDNPEAEQFDCKGLNSKIDELLQGDKEYSGRLVG